MERVVEYLLCCCCNTPAMPCQGQPLFGINESRRSPLLSLDVVVLFFFLLALAAVR